MDWGKSVRDDPRGGVPSLPKRGWGARKMGEMAAEVARPNPAYDNGVPELFELQTSDLSIRFAGTKGELLLSVLVGVQFPAEIMDEHAPLVSAEVSLAILLREWSVVCP